MEQNKLDGMICKGDVLDTLKYIFSLLKENEQIEISKYESILRKQVEELELNYRGVPGNVLWIHGTIIYSQIANQLNWSPYVSPFKIDSYVQLEWADIENSPRFRFAGAPHFDEIDIGLIKKGIYSNQLFITIINDGYPSRCGCGTAELLPEKYQSYEGIKHYVFGRDFSIYEPITEKMFSERMTELFNVIGH